MNANLQSKIHDIIQQCYKQGYDDAINDAVEFVINEYVSPITDDTTEEELIQQCNKIENKFRKFIKEQKKYDKETIIGI